MNLDQKISIVDARGESRNYPLREILFMRGLDGYALLRDLGFAAEFKDPDYENILARMLARVPDSLDKRQGSIIYDALAPAAVEFTEAYIEREANRALAYASTSTGVWLDMRVFEHGVLRMQATPAVRYGIFWADDARTTYFDDIVEGSRIAVPNSDLVYVVTYREHAGVYGMTCETLGEIGNEPPVGTELLPKMYIPGCAIVELGDSVTPGEDEESDTALYERFVKYITRPPFGGNRADYEEYFRKIDGISLVKLFRSDPEKGHVTAYILGADWAPPIAALVEDAQTQIDPFVNQGEGLGLAPMAHIVHVHGAQGLPINVSTELVLVRGVELGQVEQDVIDASAAYLLHLRKHWADYVALDSPHYVPCTVRIAQIEAAILEVQGIADLRNTSINGAAQNLILAEPEVPVIGSVELSEVVI